MKNKPNILIIHADQHRYDCLGAYGNKDIKTPNIDKLAEEGVVYTNSFCPYPVCTPSRYSLWTGLYVHQHMGWSNHCTIPPAIETFPRILKEAGYNTKAVGKMHFTPTYLDIGFEQMELAEQHGPGRYDDDYHRYLINKELVDGIDLTDQVKEYRDEASKEYWDSFGAVESDLCEEDHSTEWVGNRAIQSIEKWEESGNLLMVGFIKPHHPFDPPSTWSSMYNPEELSILDGWTEECLDQDILMSEGYFPNKKLTKEKLRKVMAYYYASISQIDDQVGKIIELLKKKNIYENTMIIYTSDHGDYMGFHHLLLKMNYMYDPVMKVPLIIKYPGQKHRGTVSNKLVNNIDVSVTVLKNASCEKGEFMQGIDLEEIKEHDFIFAENGYGNYYMVRSHTRKLLLCKEEKMSQFFDLEKDPFELNNLYNDPEYKIEIEEYKNRLFRWMLFEAPTPIYLDEDAEVIKGENVLSRSHGHRENATEYFRNKMKNSSRSY